MTQFEDPFAGTPKAAIKRELGVDNSTPLEKARRGEIFESDGLYGIKDEDGTVTYPAKYSFIGKCIDHVLFLEPSGNYVKMTEGCTESGFMAEDERPFVINGKAGIKKDGKVIIPAEYDYIRSKFGETVFYAVKNGREMYINDEGKEVLTRVRRFEGEDAQSSPFWLCSNEFDFITAMNYVGTPIDDNPNVVKIYNNWIELERYSKEEIMKMLIDPSDDLSLSEKNLELLCNDFSYEYSFYFANAKGKKPLSSCMEQFKNMHAFSNSWYYVIKLWQAPGEHVTAKELRNFVHELHKNRVVGNPIFAVGHDEHLKTGEVKMLMVTHYHERCWPAQFEYDWAEKLRTLSIASLMREAPALRKEVDEYVLDEYKEEVFQDQLLDCIKDMKYYYDVSWEDVRKALDYFLSIGSPIKRALINYAYNAQRASGKAETEFYLHAAIWAVENGDDVNACRNGASVLDIVANIMEKCLNDTTITLSSTLYELLIARGAKSFKEIDQEYRNNTDYFKQLEYMKIDGTSEKSMPGLGKTIIKT
jgi:hypothetical protein